MRSSARFCLAGDAGIAAVARSTTQSQADRAGLAQNAERGVVLSLLDAPQERP
jgi:predicted transcriptional regulator